jgi:TPR repeat protein
MPRKNRNPPAACQAGSANPFIDFTVIHNTGVRADLRDNSIRCERSHRLARRPIKSGETTVRKARMKNLRVAASRASSERLFELGMMRATGCSRPFDLVSAHMWFNLAATNGNERAIGMRQEIATEMSSAEIAAAQRAARAWSAKLFSDQNSREPHGSSRVGSFSLTG